MRPSVTRLALALLTTALAACAAHDKAGDKAAALGDWKTAYVEYRQAIDDDAKDPAMKQKFAEARQKALAQSTAQARACARQRDWGCALGEADFALGIEPTDPEMGDLKREASRFVALDKVARAEEAIGRGALPAAQQLLAGARQLSREPEVDAAARRAEQRWVAAAMAEAERLRAERRYPDAIAMVQAAAQLEPGVRPQLDQLTREYEAFRTAEHDRLMGEGEAALSQNAWADAAARFRAAQAARPDERARALERYAALVADGDQAVERADFRTAAQRYEEAVGLRVERSGYAATQLSRVVVRPYAIRVRSILVDPVRPGGVPWLGTPSPKLDRVSRELARGFEAIPHHLLKMVPRENQPNLLVEVTLPDGRRLATPDRRGLHASFDSSVVVFANYFDRRRLQVAVVHREPGGVSERVGAVEVGVGELVSRAAAQLRAPPLLALELSVDPADGADEGASTGFTALDAPRPAPASKPTPPATKPAPAPRPAH